MALAGEPPSETILLEGVELLRTLIETIVAPRAERIRASA